MGFSCFTSQLTSYQMCHQTAKETLLISSLRISPGEGFWFLRLKLNGTSGAIPEGRERNATGRPPLVAIMVREVGRVHHLLKRMIKKLLWGGGAVGWQLYYCLLHMLTSWFEWLEWNLFIEPIHSMLYVIPFPSPHHCLTMRNTLKTIFSLENTNSEVFKSHFIYTHTYIYTHTIHTIHT